MTIEQQAETLVSNLIEAWKAVGTVLTGKEIELRQSDEITYPDMRTTAQLLATYAWHGEWPYGANELSDALHELGTVVELVRGTFMLPDGTEVFTQQDKDALLRFANAATARASLDNGEALSIEMLAALAAVSEKTVRAAISPKAPNPIAITKQGHWTLIEAQQALAWLSRRPGFHPTRLQGGSPTQPPLSDMSTLTQTCKAWLSHAGLAPAGVAEQLGWNRSHSQALLDLLGERPADAFPHLGPAQLRQFARSVGMPMPDDFARQAYRVLALAHAETLTAQQLAADL